MEVEDNSNKPGGTSERQRWSSRYAFYFATIGSAVGFGNVWRFPSLVYEYGGGAFFIPYILALLFIGLPILVLEISLGQYYETGDVDVFGGIHPRLRGVGLAGIACGYMAVTYYSMLLAWVANAFFDSFGKDNIWGDGVTGSEAVAYFEDHIIGMETLPDDLEPTRMVWKNVGYSFLTWTIVYLCIAFGIKWTGRITYFTMGFPTILLFVMLGKSLTLEGAQDGIEQYLSSDFSVLVDRPEVWPKAVTQIFFSLGITFGVMTAYGSHCHRDEPAFMNSCVIAASNSLFSFVAGFAVFATLGHLAFLEDTEIKDLGISGFALVFGSWPAVLATLSGGQHWIRLFFFMLFCLGIDSTFSFMEGFIICFLDTSFLGNANTKYLCLGMTVIAWLCSFLYATDAGLIFLDTMDYYINFVLLLVGFVKSFAAGWIYNIDEQVDSLGAGVVFSFMTTSIGSVFLASILWFSIQDADTALITGFAGLIVFYTLGMMFTCYLMHKKKQELGVWSWKSMLYDLMFRNVFDLRNDLSGVVGRIPVVWAILIKFFIPPAILVLFCAGCSAKTKTGVTEFGNYSGYPTLPYQILGIMTVVFAGFLFLSSLIMPRLYKAFRKPDSPVPSKNATIHAAPDQMRRGNGAVRFSMDSTSAERVWPPKSINLQV